MNKGRGTLTHNAGFSHPLGWESNPGSLVRQTDALPTEPTRLPLVWKYLFVYLCLTQFCFIFLHHHVILQHECRNIVHIQSLWDFIHMQMSILRIMYKKPTQSHVHQYSKTKGSFNHAKKGGKKTTKSIVLIVTLTEHSIREGHDSSY